jgi:hypothetical protein
MIKGWVFRLEVGFLGLEVSETKGDQFGDGVSG